MTLREDLIAKINAMEDESLEHLASLLGYVEIIQKDDLPADYNAENDPTIGFLSGPTDASKQVKDIFAEQVEKKFSK